LWEGLGYYSRARALHQAARELVSSYAGRLPADYETLRRLPGLGEYTAGAVASLAFGQAVPAVDGNVRRVLSRLFTLPAPTTPQLQALVRGIQPSEAPGAFNEALMELGATVCRPQSPRCLICPWAEWCGARAQGRQEAFPVRTARKELPHFDVAAAVTVAEDGRILVARRPAKAMLGGMWEFPGGKREPGETLEAALARELMEEMAIEIAVGAQVTVVQHTYTHLRITLYAFWCRLLAGEPRCIECDGWQWATLEEIQALPMAITDRKIARAVEKALKS
jgi:A/G-specific adenine glycosylase